MEGVAVNDASSRADAGVQSSYRPKVKTLAGMAIAALIVGGGLWSASNLSAKPSAGTAAPPPDVAVSAPLQRDLDNRMEFEGQFSALNQVELRAQVGGVLTEIRFKDGDIVRKGQLLFVIDPVPYAIKLSEASAGLESATARLELANQELERAQTLKRTDAGSEQNVEQRTAEQRAAQAAADDALAQVRDARFDLDRCRITAPFTGRIGAHLVSTGNLVAGSRAASSPTTLLAALVSIDPIYLNFDMSEADYQAFLRSRAQQKGPLADKVQIALGDEKDFHREGRLDFLDNALDRSSGVIHARATMSNPDTTLTPGEFARVRLAVSAPAPTLLVPDAAVLADQSTHIVLTVKPDGTVAPKPVQLGDLRGGLRVIRSGLTANDRVIIDGLPYADPGAKVHAHPAVIRFAADNQG
jgi:RND family efflux transporter MFP subunit